jgi:tetratricopeptide (TPR) repeat protein
VKLRLAATGLAVLLVAGLAGTASARNPHCAGGIQYVVQGLGDKNKGNTEDYTREMNKAVDQLVQGTGEDPDDFEAMGYLGWAYAELDSAGPAGVAFSKALTGLSAKGDKKRIEVVSNNRESYWAKAYNDGIKNITDAQALADGGAKDDAKAKYDAAINKLTNAKMLKPGHAQTIRNLATAYALANRFDEAETVLRNGQTEAAADTSVGQLAEALKTVRANKASQFLDAKNYDAAITYYGELSKQETTNSDHFMGLGNAYFQRAAQKKDAERRADFKSAGDAYAKAFELKTSDANLAFNAALAYQNCGELALAEGQWRAALKQNPTDPEALSSLGSVLADEQKFDEAVKVLHQAIDAKPEEKIYYRQLGAAYSKANNNPKSTELLMMYMAMQNGKAGDASGSVPAGSAADNTKKAMGAPEKVYDWESSGQKLQTWMYLKKKQGFTFDAGKGFSLVQKSDWSAPAPAGKK